MTTPSETVYMSADHLYLASSAYRLGLGGLLLGRAPAGRRRRLAADVSDEGTTYLYDFDLDGTATTYAASGQVDGAIANRWSMDEHDGVLRVAVGPTTQTGQLQLDRHALAGRAATWSRSAASTSSASARRSSRCGGSTTWR